MLLSLKLNRSRGEPEAPVEAFRCKFNNFRCKRDCGEDEICYFCSIMTDYIDTSETSDKLSARVLADLLAAHGVKRAVLSPGSRNAPLLVALERQGDIECDVVVDERSAAFTALGMSVQSGMCVALCCTSGTALLNYAPAVAEAFYRHVPLVIVSADRPEEWIDQDDSQTIWQQDALGPYVKRRCDISARLDFDNGHWWANRVINDALLEATSGVPGPVHINIRLDAPLGQTAAHDARPERVIGRVVAETGLTTAEARALAELAASPRRVMIVAGFMEPDSKLNRALGRLADMPNIVVLTETIANLHNPAFVGRIDSTLCCIGAEEREVMAPDLVITLGGALVSRHLKEWLRSLPAEAEHWHVGHTHTTVDCLQHLSLRIEMAPGVFFGQLAWTVRPHKAPSDYARLWREASERARRHHADAVERAPWCDLKAIDTILGMMPKGWNLHLSNGTPIRYAQLSDCSRIHRCECNRGVSGIDGCTSTAIGASAVYGGVTMLLSGDMSFQYDIGALGSPLLGPRMKMVVMANGGGAIFRFIASTRSLPELEKDFAVGTCLPLEDLCRGYGIAYFEATDMESLRAVWPEFEREKRRPALLAVRTDGPLSAQVLREYFLGR